MALIDNLIDALRCLPGVGPRSAQRMAYHLLQFKRAQGKALAHSLSEAMDNVGHCEQCNTFSEHAQCQLCSDPNRCKKTLCIVAQPSDVLAMEQSLAFKGQYFVLMGLLSPLDGVGPEQLNLKKLLVLVTQAQLDEIIFAISPTVEGEATVHYIAHQLRDAPVTLSRLAQGVPAGGEIEFMDGHTLGYALQSRANIESC